MLHGTASGVRGRPWPATATRVAVWALLVVVGLALAAERPAGAQTPSILQVTVDGVITPVMADHVRDAVERAERDGHQGLIVLLDTPGGLDTSMRDIVQSFLNARVPVIVYVSPQGARAASAGAIITLASHVAAMAPGTSIGAATPIDLQGGDLSRKVINDAASYAESIAQERDRDVGFAVDAVRDGRSVAAAEALEIGAVDLIAADRAALMSALDGRSVELVDGSSVELRTTGAEVVDVELGLARSVLQWLADPNLAFLFISIGTLAIIYELANPGIGGGAIVGLILLVLAFTALSVFPVNAAGAILVVVGVALFIGELFVPGVGVLAAGGTIALTLGGFFLFRGPIGVDPAILLPTALVSGVGAVLLGRLAWRTRRLAVVSGVESIVGAHGTVQLLDGGEAQVFLQGSYWGASPSSPPLRTGERVRVIGMDGLRLIVEPDPPPAPSAGVDQDRDEGGAT